MDDLLDEDFENHKEWGIVGAGMYSPKKRDLLKKQDWLQTVIERDADVEDPRVVGCMVDYLPVDDSDEPEHKAIRDKLEDPAIKIVSMTVTEGGYYLNDGRFDPEHPEIRHE